MRVVNLPELVGPPQDSGVKSKGESKRQEAGWRERSLGPKLRRHPKVATQTRRERVVRTKSWRAVRPNEDPFVIGEGVGDPSSGLDGRARRQRDGRCTHADKKWLWKEGRESWVQGRTFS